MMIFENLINEYYRVKSMRIKFNSSVEENNLVIQATCESDNSQYTGKVDRNSRVSFEEIVLHLNARTFNIIEKNQDVLRLEIMSQEVEFYSMSKLELNELKETIRALNQKQNKMDVQIKELKDEKNKKIIIKEPLKKSEMIKSKWSETLKSDKITIKGNIARTSEFQNYFLESQFCLSNASFSYKLKSKQAWAIKINKRKFGLSLGVCLKSKMNNNFNSENINWNETGHGLYMIEENGHYYSHSYEEFNCVEKSFKFGSGDVIIIEYDPIDFKLRFIKNKVEYFEMPIIAPPEKDAYHPCVELRGKTEVELIYPF